MMTDNIKTNEQQKKTNTPDNTNRKPSSTNMGAGSADTVADRLPKNITPGQTLYVRVNKNAIVRADKVKAIVIREDNIGILLYSGIEVNANEIGNILFIKNPEGK